MDNALIRGQRVHSPSAIILEGWCPPLHCAHVASRMHLQAAVEGMERQSQQAQRYVQQERLPPAARAAAAPPIPSVDACLQGLQEIRWVVWGQMIMANHWDMHAQWLARKAAWHAFAVAGMQGCPACKRACRQQAAGRPGLEGRASWRLALPDRMMHHCLDGLAIGDAHPQPLCSCLPCSRMYGEELRLKNVLVEEVSSSPGGRQGWRRAEGMETLACSLAGHAGARGDTYVSGCLACKPGCPPS